MLVWTFRIAAVCAGDRLLVVAQIGPVRRADINERRAALPENVRDTERAADLHRLGAGDEHLGAAPARATAASTSIVAAALLLTTSAASQPVNARKSDCSSAIRPPRSPLAISISSGTYDDAAARIASAAARTDRRAPEIRMEDDARRVDDGARVSRLSGGATRDRRPRQSRRQTCRARHPRSSRRALSLDRTADDREHDTSPRSPPPPRSPARRGRRDRRRRSASDRMSLLRLFCRHLATLSFDHTRGRLYHFRQLTPCARDRHSVECTYNTNGRFRASGGHGNGGLVRGNGGRGGGGGREQCTGQLSA